MGGEKREREGGGGGTENARGSREGKEEAGRAIGGGTDLKERMIAMWGVCPSSNDKLKHV